MIKKMFFFWRVPKKVVAKLFRLFMLFLAVTTITLSLLFPKLNFLTLGKVPQESRQTPLNSLSFKKEFFSKSKNEKKFLKNSSNTFYEQVLNYFEGDDLGIVKNNEVVFKYSELFNLLPENWMELNREIELKANEIQKSSVIFLFNFLFQKDSNYTLTKFLPKLLQFLNWFRTKEKKKNDSFAKLFKISKEEWDEYENKIILPSEEEEKKNNIKKYLEKIFIGLGLLQSKEGVTKPNLLLEISADDKSKRSKPYRIKTKIKKNLIFFDFKAVLDFTLQTVPLKIKIKFKKDEFEYYSFLKAVMDFIKFIYFQTLDNFEESSKKNKAFEEWLLLPNVKDSLKPKKELIKKEFILFVLNLPLNIKIKIKGEEEKEEKGKFLFDLFEILTTTEFSEDEPYFLLETKQCREDMRILVSVFSVEISNEYGGLCKVTKIDDSIKDIDNGQKEDQGKIRFKLFEFLEDMQGKVNEIIKIKEEMKKLVADEFNKSKFFNWEDFIKNLNSFQNFFHQGFKKISDFNLAADKKDSVSMWKLAYDIWKKNTPFIKNLLIEKIKYFYASNIKVITQILNEELKKSDLVSWNSSDFAVEDVFTQKKDNRIFLVLLIKDNSLKVQKHTFVLTGEKKSSHEIVYYSPNHYEHLLNNFLQSKYPEVNDK